MSESIQLNVRVSPAVKSAVDRMAADLGLSHAATVRRALGIMQAVDDARKGGSYVGSTQHREALDMVIVTPA